jgi:hypothetical protein
MTYTTCNTLEDYQMLWSRYFENNTKENLLPIFKVLNKDEYKFKAYSLYKTAFPVDKIRNWMLIHITDPDARFYMGL